MNAITLRTPSAIAKGGPRLLFATLMLGMMAQGLAFTAFVSALPQMAQELGPRGVFYAQMTMALAATGWGLTARPAFAVGCAILMGVYAGLVLPYLYHSVTEKTDNLARSRAIGLLTAFGFLGGFLNPPVLLALANEIGLQNVFTVVSVGMLILTITTAVNLARKH